MTKRERVLAVVEGRQADRTPSAFSLHFPADRNAGQAAVDAHLEFFRQSDSDICKIMNENLLRGSHLVSSPADLAQERLTPESAGGIDAQVELAKRIVDSLGGEGVALGTIHGPMVSIHHMSGRPGFFVENLDFYRRCKEENPKALTQALDRAAEALCELTRRCIEEAGIDGIYFAALGAEKSLFTDDEYNQLVRPFDLRVFQAAAGAPGFNLLHVCKKDLSIARFREYPAQVVNWEVRGRNPSLEEAFQLFDESKTILGGFSNAEGPLLEGTEEEIARETHRLLALAKGRRFILGADCTLPTDFDPARLAAVAKASASFQG